MENQELQNDYKKLYEAEREKTEVLVSKLEESEKEIEELHFKLDRIKGSFAWKLATPLRKCLHFYEKTRDRLTRYGSIPGVMRKLRSKVRERRNMKNHGTASFPSPEEAKKQRETVFEKNIKFSILTPLQYAGEVSSGASGLCAGSDLSELGALPCGRKRQRTFVCRRNLQKLCTEGSENCLSGAGS